MAAAVGFSTAGVSPAAASPAETRSVADRLNLADLPPTAPARETSLLATAPGERCQPTATHSKARRSGATQACVSVRTSRRPARATATGRAPQASPSPSALAAGTGSCTLAAPGVYTYERFQYCVRGVEVLYTLRDSNGREIGSGALDIATSASLPAQGTTWNEHVTTTMTRASGQVTTLSAKFRSACSAGCKATKTAPWFGANLTVGQSVNGDVSYASTPAAGQQLDFTTSYTLYVTTPGAQATDPNASWSNPRKIRCDDAVRDTGAGGTASPGCVVPSVMAAVEMSAEPVSSSGQGAAAAAYHWAQRNLSDGWGFKKPLTRAKSGVADRKSATCGSFQARDDLVDNATCAEFPFAAAREGGKDGALCTDIIPNYSSGGWDYYDGSAGSSGIDTGKACTRAHVPAADLDAAEQKLAGDFTAQRVLDAEQFDLNVTAAPAQAQATCLQDPPARSFPSGTGWIRNTTEPVDQRNKTTNPPGPAGHRASVAQACLGKTLKRGTAAAGDITGWQDAQLFAAANSPGTGLARCHLIANILGGKGSRVGDQNNLVPCWQFGMNTGTPSMRTYEYMAQTEVKEPTFGPNDAIFYEVIPRYKDVTSTIPLGVEMTARIERANGTSQPLFHEEFIPNTQGGNGLYNLGN
ncbi:DNA/RNA non-specific endonuclease [Streptomyces sp. NPDC086023]|uniref:DNA/RNA non-specific endonuclease n=1 Tax=Streptomyces sp. NPDC086023 TaxID=3365746 RepID=UPI0037D879A4